MSSDYVFATKRILNGNQVHWIESGADHGTRTPLRQPPLAFSSSIRTHPHTHARTQHTHTLALLWLWPVQNLVVRASEVTEGVAVRGVRRDQHGLYPFAVKVRACNMP